MKVPDYQSDFSLCDAFPSFESIHFSFHGQPPLLFIKHFAGEGQILRNTKVIPSTSSGSVRKIVFTKNNDIYPMCNIQEIFACYVLYRKLYQNYTFSQFFCHIPLIKSTDSTCSRLESLHELFLLGFLNIRNIPKYFQTSKSTPCYQSYGPYGRRPLWPFSTCLVLVKANFQLTFASRDSVCP